MLRLQNLSKYYSRNGAVALGLRKVNLSLGLGEFVAVVGESGSGKSTLLHVLTGLDTYEDGEMYVNGEETSHYTIEDWEQYRRQYVGFVSQNHSIIESYTVRENVEIALLVAGYDPAKRRSRALEIIGRVGLTPFVNTKASKLSGGQMQRTVIARALAKDCPIIAADEPTGHLDSATGTQIIELLAEISQDKLVLIVTHNYAEVADLATRKITIQDGEVVENRQLKLDAPVRPLPVLTEATTKAAWRDVLSTAFRNLAATPMKSLLMFMVMLMLTFGTNFVYGSMLNFKDETAIANRSPYFRNTTEQRIILKRSDNAAFTPAQLESLSTTPGVVELVRGDLALDQEVAVSFPRTYGGDKMDVTATVLPRALIDRAALTSGRLPQADHEVAINTRVLRQGVSAEALLGRTFDYTYQSRRFSLTIVGISEDAKQGETVSVHANILNQIAETALAQYQTFTYSIGTFQEIPFGPHVFDEAGALTGNQIGLPSGLAQSFCGIRQIPMLSCLEQIIGTKVQLTAASVYEKQTGEYTIALVAPEAPARPGAASAPQIYVSQSTYDQWTSRQPLYQVSVMAQNAGAARSLLPRLSERGYDTLYPYDTIDAVSYLIRVLQWVLYGILLGALLAIFFFITYFIIRTVMRSKKKDYVTIRSIGASQPFINRIVFSELFLISTLTYVGALLLFGLSHIVVVPYVSPAVTRLFRAYSPPDYLYGYGLVIALVLLLTRRFQKKMFGDSVMTTLKGEDGE